MKSTRSNRGNVTKVRDLYSSGQSLRSIAEETGMREERIAQIIKDNMPKRSPRTVATSNPDNESTDLLQFLQYLKPVCWNWKLRTFKQFLEKYSKDTGGNLSFSSVWRQEYLRRYQDSLPERIRELLSVKIAKEPTAPVKPEEIFATVTELYQQLDVEEIPQRIWTFEMIEVELPEPPRKKKRDNVSARNSPEYVTAFVAASASGSVTPGTMIFKGVRIATEWKSRLKESDKDNVELLVNNTGQSDVVLLKKWLKSVFLKKVPCRPLSTDSVLPVVLFVDSSFSRPEYYDFIKSAFDEKVHIVSLPPKMKNIKLPLAVSGRPVLKDKWYEGLDDQQLLSPTAPLSRAQVVETFISAYHTLTGTAVKQGFSDCGFFPFNSSATPTEKPEMLIEIEDDMMEITVDPPLSPDSQQAVDEALALFNRAGVSETRARKLLRNMCVPGFSCG